MRRRQPIPCRQSVFCFGGLGLVSAGFLCTWPCGGYWTGFETGIGRPEAGRLELLTGGSADGVARVASMSISSTRRGSGIASVPSAGVRLCGVDPSGGGGGMYEDALPCTGAWGVCSPTAFSTGFSGSDKIFAAAAAPTQGSTLVSGLGSGSRGRTGWAVVKPKKASSLSGSGSAG